MRKFLNELALSIMERVASVPFGMDNQERAYNMGYRQALIDIAKMIREVARKV